MVSDGQFERDRLAGIDRLERLADRRRGQWTAAQRELSDQCLGWLTESNYARSFFRWLGANRRLMPWLVRTGRREAAKGYRVSMPLLYELLRSRGRKDVAPKGSGEFRFSNSLKAPLAWAFAFAYPDLAEEWELELQGPQSRE